MQKNHGLSACGIVLLVALLLPMGSCGGGGPASPAGIEASQGGFTATVLLESLVGGATLQDCTLGITESADAVEVSLGVKDAAGLKAAYMQLAFNPNRYDPVQVLPAGLLGEDNRVLRLHASAGRGRIDYGEVLIRPLEQPGFNGDGEVVKIRFARQAQTKPRTASTPPLARQSQALLFHEGGLLEWRYASQGDYDQNGEVNIADLTPLGMHFGESAVPLPAFDYESALSVIDGDGNGELNLSDITPIGQNYVRTANGGYGVFTSGHFDDYPALETQFGDPPATPAVIGVPLGYAIGTPGTDRLLFRTVAPPGVRADEYIWVRPSDGVQYGSPSNPAGGNSVPAVQFRVVSPPAGEGTEEDPYVIGSGGTVQFELYDPIADVMIPPDGPNVLLRLENPAAGVMTGGQLEFAVPFSGRVDVTAQVDYRPTNPARICLLVLAVPPAVNQPLAVIDAAPTSGQAPLNVLFYGGRSHDHTGAAVTAYEWDFGDGPGFTAGVETAVHQYPTAGSYTARLRVTAANSETAESQVLISVHPSAPNGPSAKLAATPAMGTAPLTVAFDATGSAPGAAPLSSFQYDFFGNGTYVTGDATWSVTYALPGTYRVSLRVVDTASNFGTAYADVVVYRAGGTPPPSASLAVVPAKGNSPLAAYLDLNGSTTGPSLSYRVDPGDGSAAYDPAMYPLQPHIYAAVVGNTTYTAIAQTHDSTSGLDSLPIAADVLLYPPGALCATLSASPPSGPAPLSVTLDATLTSASRFVDRVAPMLLPAIGCIPCETPGPRCTITQTLEGEPPWDSPAR